MWALLKQVLAGWESNRSEKCTQAPLFSGSAYFSNRVPRPIIETWAAHGGQVSFGATLDPRARYFFAMDPSEQWVTKLFSKSVTVIHAGWIVHCVDESFRVPISQYVLDDSFIPGPPYKLTSWVPRVCVGISSEPEPLDPADPECSEHAPTTFPSSSGGRSSNAPSTPPKVPLKRKREQAYYDSPSGSLVFSGFDKDGIPRRPTKQRKLRFDPSFSPQNGWCGKDKEKRSSVDWVENFLETFGNDDESIFGEVDQQSVALKCRGGVNFVQSADTPNKPFCYNGSPADPRRSGEAETVSKLSFSPRQTISATPVQVKCLHPFDKSPQVRVPGRTIDFTNLSRTRRFRFQDSGVSAMTFQNSISAVKTETVNEKPEVRTPKKISFADQAQVRVYMVSPPPPESGVNLKEVEVVTTIQNEHLNEIVGDETVQASTTKVGFADRARVRVYAMDDSPQGLVANEAVTRCEMEELTGVTGTTADERIKARTFDAVIGSSDNPTAALGSGMDAGGSEDSTLTLTLEDVQAMRRQLIELDAKNRDGVGDGRLATVFEVGKTFRGMMFRHVW